MKKITKSDWVGLRALYLLIASDASAAQSPEVCRIMSYYTQQYGNDAIDRAICEMAKDNAWRNTFDNESVAFARRLDSAIKISGRDGEFQEIFYDITKDMT